MEFPPPPTPKLPRTRTIFFLHRLLWHKLGTWNKVFKLVQSTSWRCTKLYQIFMRTTQLKPGFVIWLFIHHIPLPKMLPDELFSFANPTKLKGKSNVCHRERKINIGLQQPYIYGTSRVWFQWSVPFHLSLLSPSHCFPSHSSQSLKKICFICVFCTEISF